MVKLERLFAELIRHAFTGLGLKTPASDNLQELTHMMQANLLTLGESWKERAIAEGKADALRCLLETRFGALTPSLHERIREAKLATLDLWFKCAIAAPDLASVFAPRAKR